MDVIGPLRLSRPTSHPHTSYQGRVIWTSRASAAHRVQRTAVDCEQRMTRRQDSCKQCLPRYPWRVDKRSTGDVVNSLWTIQPLNVELCQKLLVAGCELWILSEEIQLDCTIFL